MPVAPLNQSSPCPLPHPRPRAFEWENRRRHSLVALISGSRSACEVPRCLARAARPAADHACPWPAPRRCRHLRHLRRVWCSFCHRVVMVGRSSGRASGRLAGGGCCCTASARPRMPAAFPAQAWRGGHLDDARGEILQMAATPPGCPIDTRVGVRGMRQFASAKAPAFPCTAILLARSETAIWSHPRPSQCEGNEAPSDAFPRGPPARRLQSARPSPSRFAGDLVQRLQAPHSQAPPPSSTLFPGAARSALARACVAALS